MFALNAALLSLFSFAITKCNAQASFIRIPSAGAVITAGQNITVQIVRPNSIEGSQEVGLAIGLVNCPTSPCPTPAEEMGRVLYAGSFNPQLHEIPGEPYQNFSVYIPTVAEGDSTGTAQIQVARLHLIGAGPSPILELNNVTVSIKAVPTAPFTVHPVAGNSKCVGIVGGVYANGSQVDIYDCNGSSSQKWEWIDRALVSINPVDQSQWCLDAGEVNQLANGVQMKIWSCFVGLAQQTWFVPALSTDVVALSVGDWCLDLTNGNTTNRNILQVWTCTGDTNQYWNFVNV